MKQILRNIRQRYQLRKLSEYVHPMDHPAFALGVAVQRKKGAQIGKRCRFLGRIDGINPQLVTIGDYCVLGGSSMLLAHGPTESDTKPVTLGNFVYLGFGVIVLPAVSIGDFCIVGAGAVVTKEIPTNSVVAENPARLLRSLTAEERKTIRKNMLNDLIFGKVKQPV